MKALSESTSNEINRLPKSSSDEQILENHGETGTRFSGNGLNALTCDVEDYFQVSAFEHLVSKQSWSGFECRVSRNVDRILQMTSDSGTKGTFFILGWVAKHHPAIVRRIAENGHEIASHGVQHVRVFNMSEEDFRADADLSRKLLQDVSGQPVIGYRAASWSFDLRTPWAHKVLAECGYTYSSSIYPVAHDHYGMPDAPTTPFYVGDTGVLEIPATTARIFGRNWPAAGGGYFRLLPYGISRWMFAKSRTDTAAPSVFYFHPWELDPEQPRITGASAKARFRHYVNLTKFEGRLAKMLSDFEWGRMDKIYFGQRS